jgi:hypothetical protein
MSPVPIGTELGPVGTAKSARGAQSREGTEETNGFEYLKDSHNMKFTFSCVSGQQWIMSASSREAGLYPLSGSAFYPPALASDGSSYEVGSLGEGMNACLSVMLLEDFFHSNF